MVLQCIYEVYPETSARHEPWGVLKNDKVQGILHGPQLRS
jgi:hypothetical protein